MILSKTYTEPAICEKEILRYAGGTEVNSKTLELVRECINEIRPKLAYKVCYHKFNVKICGEVCDFGAFSLNSRRLALNLQGCKSVIIFAATIGVEIDRVISKYGRISPAKALMLQGVGAERIEALCDAFCADIAKEYNLFAKPRFSPGYADLSLDTQKDIFSVLSPEKHIGLFLTDSMLMSPSKSVTAIVGLGEKEFASKNKCTQCNQIDCAFRGAL